MFAIGDEEQRASARRFVLANFAAELRRVHVEEVVSENDEMWSFEARLLQTFGAGERGQHDVVAAAQDRLLKKQRAA